MATQHNPHKPGNLFIKQISGKQHLEVGKIPELYSSQQDQIKKLRVHFSVLDNNNIKTFFEKFEKKQPKVFLENFFDTDDSILLQNDIFVIERFDCETQQFTYKLKAALKKDDSLITYNEITEIPEIVKTLEQVGIKVDELILGDIPAELGFVMFGWKTTRYVLKDDLFFDFISWGVCGKRGYYVVGTKEIDLTQGVNDDFDMDATLSKVFACMYSTVPEDIKLMKFTDKKVSNALLEMNKPIDPDVKSEARDFFLKYFREEPESFKQ